MRQITGNKLLVRALKEEGVDTLFGYPGACTIDISDELYKQDEIRVILPRHEQALVMRQSVCKDNGKSRSMSGNERTGGNESGDRTCHSQL